MRIHRYGFDWYARGTRLSVAHVNPCIRHTRVGTRDQEMMTCLDFKQYRIPVTSLVLEADSDIVITDCWFIVIAKPSNKFYQVLYTVC